MIYAKPNEIQDGIIKFITQDMLPKTDGWRRVAFGTCIMLAAEKDFTSEIMSSPVTQLLGITNDDGRINIDRLKDALQQQIGMQKLTIDIPAVGSFKVGQSDIEKIYKNIVNNCQGMIE